MTATPDLDEMLVTMVERDASDLIIKSDSPPLIRIYGDLYPMDFPPLSPEQAREISYKVVDDRQRVIFERDWELDVGYEIRGVARYRVNCFVQRGFVGSVFRLIPLRIRTMEDLMLPDVCRYFADRPRGLILVTGPAGW
jgi:twitching motility protein PilT